MSDRSRPTPVDDATSRRLERQRRRDTGPELRLRRELWGRGLRFRVDLAVVDRRRRVDIAFTRAKVAVFVDGCFWHSCPIHRTSPRNNADWWRAKLDANVERDRRTDDQLRDAGWRVLRFWEHEDVSSAADRVEFEVRGGAVMPAGAVGRSSAETERATRSCGGAG